MLATKALREAESGAALDAVGRAQAEREAALFHLHGAVLGLLHEIAGFYRLPGADASTVDALLAIPADCPELAELRQLVGREECWLAVLLAAHAALLAPPRAPHKAADSNLIATASVQPARVDADRLQAWQLELKNLALRFREAMVDS